MQCVYAKKLYTGTDVKQDGFVLFDEGVIVGVSGQSEGDVVGRYDCITPAFVDPHCHIGMARAGEPSSESETNEHMDSVIAHADALDSVQMDDSSFADSVEAGVMYSCVTPGSGNIVGGKTVVLRNYAPTTQAAYVRRAGIKGAFGYNPMSTREWKGQRPFTRMGALAILRAKLHEVKQKMLKTQSDPDADVTFSLEEAVLRSLLSRRERFRVHVHKSDDVYALLRIVDEFNLDITVEHACDVHDDETFRELARRKIPVVFGPLDALAYKVELKHEHWSNIRYLLDSGVEFGLMTDHPVLLQRMLLVELRWFIRCGLTPEEAIGVITHRNARILGLNGFLGTIEPGKWASFSCWNGEPFDLASHIVAGYGEGTLIYTDGQRLER